MDIDNPIVLTAILLGGFAVSLLIAVVAMFPWFKQLPKRWAIVVAGIIPPAVLTGMMLTDLLVRGRQPKVLAAMSPIVLALILPGLTLFASCRKSELPPGKRGIGICLSILLILVVMWASVILWAMTDRNFMGAGC